MDSIVKFFTKTAISAARSLLLSEVKGGVKSFLNNKRAKTLDDLKQEMTQKLGYITSHYTVNQKTQDISYKSSPVFVHEWLTNSTHVNDSIVRDEESGHIYVNGELITNTKKLDLIEQFVASTGAKSASLSGHFEAAFKLIDLSDFNAGKFAKHFDGWVEGDASIIDGWIDKTFGHILETDPDYAKLLFRKWIIGTAKRAISPGCSFDGCLTLQGFAGVGKTAFFRNLLPAPFDQRTGEILCQVKNPQKFVESIKGKTIACFDELSVLEYPRSLETFKQLLSSQAIDVRLAWAREPSRYALRQGFSATTNKTKFIPDPFLSRRLWTIQLNDQGRLNFDYLFTNRHKLWQEAVFLAKKNESHILSVDEQRFVLDTNAKYLVE